MNRPQQRPVSGQDGIGPASDKCPRPGPGGVTVTGMGLDDVDQVIDIERRVYPSPWSAGAFYGEITENMVACYIVARFGPRVAGYAGMWVLLDEAHITNIAVHPDFQRCGIGSLLLEELMDRAYQRGARRMTLEVRPSNHGALGLYRRYAFVRRGLRRGYYSDTHEDAILMWKDDISPRGRQSVPREAE